MAALYSVRFALATGGTFVYVVPAGKRAVIKCVSMFNYDTVVRTWQLAIPPHPVLYRSLPASGAAELENLHIVVNAGESIEGSAGPKVGYHVSGYLLEA